MTELELKRYHELADKRDNGKLSRKEHKEWLILVDKSFNEGMPRIFKVWEKGFNL